MGDVKENRTTKISHPRSLIMAKNHDTVIKPVLAPKPFMACGVWQMYWPIVIAIVRRIAPAIPLRNE